ncbi:MAG: preprotein translocase subunit SecG [Bacteroidetes bacterium]|nr:preprotein translocase subunit SecG [Bacteroidota bacterium]
MSILLIIASILLIIVVLIQNSKGGGLDSSFASQTSAFGAKRTTDIIEKITWGIAASLAVLCLASTLMISSDKGTASAVINSEKKEAPKNPASGIPAPAGQQ